VQGISVHSMRDRSPISGISRGVDVRFGAGAVRLGPHRCQVCGPGLSALPGQLVVLDGEEIDDADEGLDGLLQPADLLLGIG